MANDHRHSLVPSRLRGPQLLAIDVVVTAVIVAVSLSDGWRASVAWAPDWLAGVAGVAALAPLAVRRLWPLPVFAAVLTCSTASVLISGARYPSFELALAIYVVAVRLPARTALSALAVTLAALCAAVLPAPPLEGTGSVAGLLATSVVLVVATTVVGLLVCERRCHAERLSRLIARQAADQERLRIARELHDAIAHGMSLIAVQASVANYVVEEQPDEARRALISIEETSRAGLRELRLLLGVLRTREDGDAAGLSGLDDLVARFGRAGLPVRVRVTGAPRPLAPSVDHSLYRIVQEALTNVVKHADATRAEVEIGFQPGSVVVKVTDDGRGPAGTRAGGRAGQGIIGMRERAALAGGELTAGPLPPPRTGFQVGARLPLTGAAS